MSNITSVQDGDWNTAVTWDSGTVPTSSDDVFIEHDITIAADISARYVTIGEGSLHVADSYGWGNEITADVQLYMMTRKLHDTRKVNLDGVVLKNVHTNISCRTPTAPDGFPSTPDLNNGLHVIIDDPGHLSCSARLRDILPEGCAPAYTEKISNAVRYMTATVHIQVGYLRYLASLYRMARGPFQVLLVTNTCLIKGFIENVTPDPQSVGKEYVTVKVTVAEGPGA